MAVKTMMLSIEIPSQWCSSSPPAPDISSNLLLHTISPLSVLNVRGGSSEDDITRGPWCSVREMEVLEVLEVQYCLVLSCAVMSLVVV